MKRIYAPLALALLAAPAQANPTWGDLISPDRLSRSVIELGISSLRSLVPLTYQGLVVDLENGRIALNGLYVDLSDLEAGCTLDMRRATLWTTPWDVTENLLVRFSAQDVTIPEGCFDVDLTSVLGTDQVFLPHLGIEVDYHLPSGSAVVDVTLVAEDIAALQLEAEFDYLSVEAPLDGSDNPDFAAILASARLTLQDLGGWGMARESLPQMVSHPEIAPGLLTQNLSQELEAAVYPANADLAHQAGLAWEHFLNGESQIHLSTPDRPDGIDLNAIFGPGGTLDALGEAAAVAELALQISAGAPDDRSVLDQSLVRRVIEEDASVSHAEYVMVAERLLSGRGVPRNDVLARDILSRLAAEGDGAAAVLLADALSQDDPARAYRFAQQALAAGLTEAVSTLDALENRLSVPQVLALQPGLEVLTQDPPSEAQALRRLGTARLNGLGAERSYVLASYWLRLAQAAGDLSAGALLRDLEATMTLLGGGNAWRATSDRAGQQALADWVRVGLAPQTEGNN